MARTTRCKMNVNRIEYSAGKYHKTDNDGKVIMDDDGKPILEMRVLPKVILNPVYEPSANGDHENHVFWSASPSGECWLNINNPLGAEVFEIGKSYYVDFTLAD
jgi:hypothetical protein